MTSPHRTKNFRATDAWRDTVADHQSKQSARAKENHERGSDKTSDRLDTTSMVESPLSRAGLLLTIPEAAAALRISRSSIYRLFDSGQLSWVKICGSRRVTLAEINRFIAAHTEVAS